MKAKNESTPAKKAPAKKPTRTRKAEPTQAPATLPIIKQEFRPSPAIMREHAPVPGEDSACCIACAAKMLMPSADPERVGDFGRLRALATVTSWKDLYNADGNFCHPLTGAAFIRAAMRTPGLYARMQKELAKWAGEHLAFFNRGNPERIAAQLAIYGIDSGSKDFYLRTPKAWKAQGHEVKPNARPVFVITPLFSDQEKEKAEKDGAAIVATEATEPTGKKRRKFYACHAVFATCDTVQTRVIKRRGPRKQKTTADDYRAAVMTPPAAPAPTPEPAPVPVPAPRNPRKAAIKPLPAPAFAPSADSADLMQLALAL